MPSAATMLEFAGASLVVLAIPGPAVLFIVTRSTTRGTRAGLLSVAGVHTASAVHVAAAVCGVSALIVASATAFTVVRLLGAVYLVGLGLRVLCRPRAPVHASVDGARHRLFVQAFTVNLLNPKVAVFFLAFLPQFVHAGDGAVWSQTIGLGALYIALGLCSDSLYALTAGGIARRVRHRDAPRRKIGRVAEGTVLIGLGITSLAIPHRRAT